MKKFHFAAVVLGGLLLVYLIFQIGPASLERDLRTLGWGLVPFILLEGVAGIFYTLGWCRCLSPAHRSMSFFRLWAINLAGNSITYFTPTASLGGELVKGTLLSMDHAGPEAASGIIIGKLSYALSQLLFVVFGSLLFLWQTPLHLAGTAAMVTGSILLGAGIIAFLIVQMRGKLGAVVRWAAERGMGGEALRGLARQVTRVDESLQLSYRERPGALPLSMLWHAVGLACSIVKTWYFLSLLTGGSFFSAAGVFLLGTWFDLLTFMIPLGIGVQEGTRILAFTALGFHSAQGLTYGIALRLEQIFWAGGGLLLYLSLLGAKKAEGIEARGKIHRIRCGPDWQKK